MKRAARRFCAWLIEVLSLPVSDAWWLFLQWLRRPRWAKRGHTRPIVVTQDGVAVPSVRHVPVRSTKADAKRTALAFARRQFNDPAMTWGQARKRLAKLERQLRDEGMTVGE
jgi:hypothetical protein